MIRISGKTVLDLNVNGYVYHVAVYPFQTLLDVLRDELGLPGCRPGCENGDCGACTVLMDGWPMKSCLTLAVETAGHEITTIEGLTGSPLVRLFASHFAMQCGYCSPGFVLVCHSLLSHFPDPDDCTTESWLQSNICRCTSYEEISAALHEAIINGQEKKT
jgi:aerobic-type carbon monoxide dehydrogenase small subunit (CoxS/CutS family)